MTINIIQTITNVLDEKRHVIKTSSVEAYIIYPDDAKCIKNIITGKVYTSSVNIGTKNNLSNYIEIDKE